MGGFGSGRRYWRGGRDTIDGLKSIDIRLLNKQGYFKPSELGKSKELHWSRNGSPRGYIGFILTESRIFLFYRYRDSHTEDWESVDQSITIDETPCHFGGVHKWFICPNCSRRVAVLYAGGKLFLCRHCYRLAYACQNEDSRDRLMRKCRKIRERLGADGNLFQPVYGKPKGMHEKTFIRLRNRAELIRYTSLKLALMHVKGLKEWEELE